MKSFQAWGRSLSRQATPSTTTKNSAKLMVGNSTGARLSVVRFRPRTQRSLVNHSPTDEWRMSSKPTTRLDV